MTNLLMTDRREAMKALLAISAASAMTACLSGEEAGQGASKVSSAPTLSASEMALVAALGQAIIPKTETAGAIEAGVPDVIQSLFTDWADDNTRRYWRAGLQNLDQHFVKSGGQSFAKMNASQQASLLEKYDAKAFAESGFDDFYRNIKNTIARAYYMSEAGASEELVYEPVPGDFKGCVPLSDQPINWAT